MPQVAVPPRYRGPTRGIDVVDVDADTIRTCIAAVEARHPGFRELILDAEGKLRRFVRIFVNGEAIDRSALDTRVAPADQIQILASAAGG
jgi:molybdopterin synthase sulfur carrier subunit